MRNGCDRLGTLTFAPEHLPGTWQEVWEHTERFRRELKRLFGREVALVLVIERGGEGGRLHVQFVASRYVPWQLLRRAWKVGHVHIERKAPARWKQLGKRERCRRAAAYVAKYVAKAIDQQPERAFNGKRYSTTRGMAATARSFAVGSRAEGFAVAQHLEDGAPLVDVWSSDEVEDWCGPPVWCLRFGDP